MADAIQHWDLSLGTLLVASWINYVLFTIELLQMWKFFSKYRKTDSWMIQTSLLIALAADTATVLANSAACYLYQVTHFGDTAFAVTQPWPMSLSTVWWLVLFVPCMAAGWIGTFGTWIGLRDANTLAKRHQLQIWVSLWTAGSAGCDIILSGVLIFLLRNHVQSDFSHTTHAIKRIIIVNIRNGTFTAGIAIACLIFSLWRPDTNLDVLCSIVLGRVATLTYLSNLNGRGGLRAGNSGSKSTSSGRANDDKHMQHGGVAVSRHVTRHEVEADEESEVGIELQKAKSSYSANPGDDEIVAPVLAVDSTRKDVSSWDSRSKVASNTALV